MKTNKHKKGKARKYFIKTFIIFKKAYIGKNSHLKMLAKELLYVYNGIEKRIIMKKVVNN